MTNAFRYVVLCFVFLGLECGAQTPVFPWDNLPMKIREAFGEASIKEFDPSLRINPFYLRADLDGDGKPDYAVLVTKKADGKRGFVVWLSSDATPHVLGAGKPTKYGSRQEVDLDFDSWRIASRNRIDRSSSVELPPGQMNDCIFVQKSDSASGLYCFQHGRFNWFQQGD
jgi:hypothetical protein